MNYVIRFILPFILEQFIKQASVQGHKQISCTLSETRYSCQQGMPAFIQAGKSYIKYTSPAYRHYYFCKQKLKHPSFCANLFC